MLGLEESENANSRPLTALGTGVKLLREGKEALHWLPRNPWPADVISVANGLMCSPEYR